MAYTKPQTDANPTAEIPATQANFGQASVGTGASVQLLGSTPSRRVALITNSDATNKIFIGGTSGVTSGTGHPVAAGTSMSISYAGALWAISTGGTVLVGASEIYDPN